jgi:RNA polymerase sigma factor (sigma-70 family)
MKGGGRVNDFDKIYEDHGDLVYKYLISLTRNSSLAEELTQETFYQALKSIHRFKGECKLSVWLCQIAKHCYLKYINKHKREEFNFDLIVETLVTNESPENINEKKAEKIALLKAVHKLPEPYREIVNLRTYGDLSFKEIGEVFDNSENWARTTFYRAKLKLRDIILQGERRDRHEDKL